MPVLLSADVAVVVGIRAAARISGRLRGRAFDTLADSAQHARLQRRRAAARRALLRLRGRLLAVALGGWRANGGELRRRRKVRRDTAAAARCLWAASQPKDTNHDQAGAVLTVMYRTIFLSGLWSRARGRTECSIGRWRWRWGGGGRPSGSYAVCVR